jgi:archaellin
MRLKSMIACVAIAAVAPVALIACGSDSKSSSSGSSSGSSSSSSSGTSKDAVCTARDNLQQSVTDLADPTVLTGGKSGIDSAVNKVQDNLDALESAAKSDYKPQVDAVNSSFDQLKTAVNNVGNGKLSDNLQQISDAISKIGTSTSSLYDALKTKCG